MRQTCGTVTHRNDTASCCFQTKRSVSLFYTEVTFKLYPLTVLRKIRVLFNKCRESKSVQYCVRQICVLRQLTPHKCHQLSNTAPAERVRSHKAATNHRTVVFLPTKTSLLSRTLNCRSHIILTMGMCREVSGGLEGLNLT